MHRTAKTYQQNDSLHEQQVITNSTDAAADAASADDSCSADATGARDQMVSDPLTSNCDLSKQDLNESLPGQLKSPDRRAKGICTASPTVSDTVEKRKLQLPPLRVSRNTGAAYYVDENGKSVWASALPPPSDSMLGPDGKPWRDVYHSGPHHATHMDNLPAKATPCQDEAPPAATNEI